MIGELGRALMFTVVVVGLFSGSASAEPDVCSVVTGAKLIAQDDKNTFIGEITNQLLAPA
jgi:hypothetical protein